MPLKPRIGSRKLDQSPAKEEEKGEEDEKKENEDMVECILKKSEHLL